MPNFWAPPSRSEEHGEFTAEFVGSPTGRNRWETVYRCAYQPPTGPKITVPAGTETDLDSTPRRWLKLLAVLVGCAVPYVAAWCGLVWGLALLAALLVACWTFPTREQAASGAAIHDELYRRRWPRRKADAIAWHAWQAAGAPGMGPVWASLFWVAVRLFGRRAYRRPELSR